MFELEMSAAADVGMVRENNQDVARVVPRLALALVADGMGGHDQGEIASRLVVDAAEESYERMGAAGQSVDEMAANVLASIRAANLRVLQQRLTEHSEMGTTIVMAAFGHGHVALAHVGDSRLYRLRGGALERLTEDHSLTTKLRSEGHSEEEALRWEHILTRAMTGDLRIEVDVRVERCQREDEYLLCSDGLWGAVPDKTIGRMLQLADSVEDACTRLIRAALLAGGGDNISVAIVRCGAPKAPS